jgi:hypothetical protein
MLDLDAIAKHYQTLTDGELLNLQAEGGFADEALPVLRDELARRKLTKADLTQHIKSVADIRLADEAKEKGLGGRGPGLMFFGRRYLNADDKAANIQIQTKFFSLGGFPLIPLASYRLKCKGGEGKWFDWSTNRQVLNRVPLDWPQVIVVWTKAVLAVVGFLALAIGYERLMHR